MPVGANPLLPSARSGGAEHRERALLCDSPLSPVPPPPAQLESFAHDLRNILSGVRGYAQLLLSMAHEEWPTRGSRSCDGAKIVEYLVIIEAESSRCCELVERMLRPEERVLSQAECAQDAASKSDAARVAEDRLT